jgi:hypothetical protein
MPTSSGSTTFEPVTKLGQTLISKSLLLVVHLYLCGYGSDSDCKGIQLLAVSETNALRVKE